MKLTQLQEATYYNQDPGWCIHVIIKDEDQMVGPYASKEEATEVVTRILKMAKGSHGHGWFDEKDFDLYDKVVKIISPQEMNKYLNI